ncbi:hypothetical protein TNCV_3770811 [Trichonephila clavipes]|nr:hypothetical protein TNCV_3770811 [Trichonephila clavipes]
MKKKRVCKEKLTDATAGGTKLEPALTLIPVLMRGKCTKFSVPIRMVERSVFELEEPVGDIQSGTSQRGWKKGRRTLPYLVCHLYIKGLGIYLREAFHRTSSPLCHA